MAGVTSTTGERTNTARPVPTVGPGMSSSLPSLFRSGGSGHPTAIGGQRRRPAAGQLVSTECQTDCHQQTTTPTTAASVRSRPVSQVSNINEADTQLQDDQEQQPARQRRRREKRRRRQPPPSVHAQPIQQHVQQLVLEVIQQSRAHSFPQPGPFKLRSTNRRTLLDLMGSCEFTFYCS